MQTVTDRFGSYDIGDAFNFGDQLYTPEQAKAAIAAKQAEPVPGFISYSGIPGYLRTNSYERHGWTIANVDFKDQQAAPTNPGIRKVSVSTYGITIPVSLGARRLAGNIIQSSDIVPRLVGGREYYVEYLVPLVDSDKCGAKGDADGNPCSDDPCNPKFGPCSEVPEGFFCVNFPIEQACDDIGNPPPGDCGEAYSFEEALSIACAYNVTTPLYPACIFRQSDGALVPYECE